jgi:hypothetical protein
MMQTPARLPPSSIRREFLGWDRPALPEAARRLAVRYRQGGTLDLGRVIVVMPGQRAGRRLQELLAFLAEDDGLRLTPPQVVTEGRLPEMLYTPRQPFASEVVQDLAWARALRDLPAEQRRHIVPHPPGADDVLRWLELGKVLRGLHVELAADDLDFAAVRTLAPAVADFAEAERWEALVHVQRRYHDLLDAQELWDIQTARLTAIKKQEIRTDCDIILLGTVDLNKTIREMLKQVAVRVTACVVAPEDRGMLFDEYGCLAPALWAVAEVPLSDDQLRQVDGPVEQADAVSAWLSELAGRYRVDEVAIGVPDESLVPQLQRQLEQCGVAARWVEGVRLTETAPYRLLAAAVRFADGYRYDDLAALLRHPDLEDWLQDQGVAGPRQAKSVVEVSRHAHRERRGRDLSDAGIGADLPLFFGMLEPTSDVSKPAQSTSLPAQLDLFYNEHLPSRLYAGVVRQNARDWPNLKSALARVEDWLGDAARDHPLREWGNIFRSILGHIYGRRTLDLDVPADEVLHRTLRRILDECDQLAELPEALDLASWTAADALHIAMAPLATEALPPPANASAVEILGWLELPLDDSRALVVTSFNEGFVPKSTGADAFLPDRLRRVLGLLHNERRYARDAYAATVLCQREELRVLFARRDTLKDPLRPSRLLFACPDDTLISRARRFFGEPSSAAASRHWLLSPGIEPPAKSGFKVPPPRPLTKRREQIAVTDFKVYLACPYRYYLRRVCNLKAIDDSAREMGGDVFGTLLHRVLGAFGREAGELCHSEREQDIADFLAARLEKMAEEEYGSDQRRPAIRLQLEQARRRLSAFALRQVELVREGWRIVYVEGAEGKLAVPYPRDRALITLVGRIDRIDLHEAGRKVRILDYKTADNGANPETTHRKDGRWIDLQLPLYRHLWRQAVHLPDISAIELGYFNLPKELDETQVVLATWDEQVLASADSRAEQVIQELHSSLFWPPHYDPVPDYCEDLAAICLDSGATGPALADDDQGETS